MKKRLVLILSILGVVFLGVIIAIAMMFYFGGKLDKESKAYVDSMVPSVFGRWDSSKIMQHASPEFLATLKSPQDKARLEDLFRVCSERLGMLKQYKGSEGQATVHHEIGKGKMVYADYTARGVFEKGEAKIIIRIIRKGDKWQIYYFNVTSPALLSATLSQKQPSLDAAKKEDAKKEDTSKKTPEPKTVVGVEYTAGTKRDPFMPLIIKAEAKPKSLIPIESYEVSEFKLIAILWDKTKYYAVVTLPDGKSYTITEGIKLGLHGGKVYKITKDSVIIREQMRDYKGAISPKDTILKLRREEEQ
jgi:Tfp pilus assembly protein PilP